MNYLLFGFLLALAAIGFLFEQNDALKANIETWEVRHSELELKYNTSEENNRKLVEAEQTRIAEREELLVKQNELKIVAENRQQTIRRLRDEIAEIKIWSDQPLPAGIIRLYDHSNFRTSTDYLEHMRSSTTLSLDGRSPSN